VLTGVELESWLEDPVPADRGVRPHAKRLPAAGDGTGALLAGHLNASSVVWRQLRCYFPPAGCLEPCTSTVARSMPAVVTARTGCVVTQRASLQTPYSSRKPDRTRANHRQLHSGRRALATYYKLHCAKKLQAGLIRFRACRRRLERGRQLHAGGAVCEGRLRRGLAGRQPGAAQVDPHR